MNHTVKLEKIKFYYSQIYLWHKERGMGTAERMKGNNSEYIEEYLRVVENLPIPSEADIEGIKLITRKVRSGILEWNYGEKYIIDMCLGEIAKTIDELINNLNNEEDIFEKSEPLKTFDRLITEKQDYMEIATNVYSSFNVNNEKNIGGRIALIDTNWEFQKESNDDVTIFRNLDEMNFENITDSENIFHLTKDGKISIISIKII